MAMWFIISVNSVSFVFPLWRLKPRIRLWKCRPHLTMALMAMHKNSITVFAPAGVIIQKRSYNAADKHRPPADVQAHAGCKARPTGDYRSGSCSHG